jgi:hypothetical protein
MSGSERSEGKIKADCLRYLKELKQSGERVEWLKISGSAMQRSGEPDLLIIYDKHKTGAGRAYFVELKREDEQPSPLQRYRADCWARAGATSVVCRSLQELKNLLQR